MKAQITENDITRMVYEAAKRILKEWRYGGREIGNKVQHGFIQIDLDYVFANLYKPRDYTDQMFDYFNSQKKVNDFEDVYYYIDATFRYDAPDPEVGWGGNGWELEEDKGIDDLIRMIQGYPEFSEEEKGEIIRGVQEAYEKAKEEGDWTIEEKDNPFDLDMRDYYEDR